jgi:hypothetical protein
MQPKQITFRIFICLFFIAFVLLMKKYVELRKAETNEIPKEQPKEIIIEKQATIKYDTLKAWVTLYHPSVKECGNNRNITFTGQKGHVGGCAVSQRMLDYYCNFFDTIIVPDGILKGKYVINDKDSSRTMLVDVWRPIDDSLKGCYKTKILIKRK